MRNAIRTYSSFVLTAFLTSCGGGEDLPTPGTPSTQANQTENTPDSSQTGNSVNQTAVLRPRAPVRMFEATTIIPIGTEIVWRNPVADKSVMVVLTAQLKARTSVPVSSNVFVDVDMKFDATSEYIENFQVFSIFRNVTGVQEFQRQKASFILGPGGELVIGSSRRTLDVNSEVGVVSDSFYYVLE